MEQDSLQVEDSFDDSIPDEVMLTAIEEASEEFPDPTSPDKGKQRRHPSGCFLFVENSLRIFTTPQSFRSSGCAYLPPLGQLSTGFELHVYLFPQVAYNYIPVDLYPSGGSTNLQAGKWSLFWLPPRYARWAAAKISSLRYEDFLATKSPPGHARNRTHPFTDTTGKEAEETKFSMPDTSTPHRMSWLISRLRLVSFFSRIFRTTPSPSRQQGSRPVFAVIDTETTGFNKRYDRIIELAVARFDESFNLVDQWHTLLNPDGKAINNAHIHGITNADVAQAPLFRDIYTEFAARLDGMVLMAHNAPFDSKMIVAEVDRITPPGTPDDAVFFGFVDTIALAKQLVDVPSYKLSSLLELVGLANPNAHAAIADATATGMLFNKLLDNNAAQLGRQILDQAQFFNATHAKYWQLPQHPPLPRR